MKTEEHDEAVLDVIWQQSSEEYMPIVDMLRIGGFKHGTVRGALSRLLAAHRVDRKWNGNQRFGRYVYRAV
jgi:hypothetical protein